jgi:hypothetical protein
VKLGNSKARAFAVPLLVLSIIPLALAQAAEIHGHVLDPQNTPVAGARVSLLNSAGEQIAEATMAKIDPDTGLQEAVGPSLNRVIAVSLQRDFSAGSLYISYAQADARDRETGEPIPEAPRTMWDAVGSLHKLPLRLQARGEFEYVKAKPLGDGFTGAPVTEIRGAVLRPFLENRMSIGTNFLIASGYTGQTTEVLALPSDAAPFERAVGVPLKSYVSMSWTYYFRR